MTKPSEAFQIVDAGPNKFNKKNDNSRSGSSSRNEPTKGKDNGCDIALCLWEPHRKAGIRYYLKLYKEYPAEEKTRIRDQMVVDKARTGPAKSTFAQIVQQTGQQKQSQPLATETVG